MQLILQDFSERVKHAGMVMVRGGPYNRKFDSCFEMGDGDAVVKALLQSAERRPKLWAACVRFGWTEPGYLPDYTPPAHLQPDADRKDV